MHMKNLKIGEEILYLKREECANLDISKNKIIKLVENCLVYHSKKEVEMPAKIGIHPKNENTFLHAMPSYIPGEKACGLKWVGGFPDNPHKHNLPHISGLLVLNDDETGFPLAVLDATWITTVRTVAATMIGIKYLAGSNVTGFGMIGCGDIGRNHISFLSTVLPNLERIVLYDKYESAMDKVIETFQPNMQAKIVKAKSLEELVKSVDIITSATIFARPNPQIKDKWITKGQTILLCDGHTLYEDKTIKRSDKYIVDGLEQAKHFEKLGYYTNSLPEVYAELGEVVAGAKKGRERKEEIIVNNNIGMAVEDVVVGKVLFNKAIDKGIGVRLPL